MAIQQPPELIAKAHFFHLQSGHGADALVQHVLQDVSVDLLALISRLEAIRPLLEGLLVIGLVAPKGLEKRTPELLTVLTCAKPLSA